MANILRDFNICDRIPQNIKICIKLFHVFEDHDGEQNIIFTTTEDKVYGLGSNQYGCLGFGHEREVTECTEIEELSNLKIVDLLVTQEQSLTIIEGNKIFVWGQNDYGQLGLGYRSFNLFKPFEIKFSNTEIIDDIKFGLNHTLVLLKNRLLYGWGYNGDNQLGFGDEEYFKPKRLTIYGNEFRFRYIYCFDLSSFAVTTNGELFSWGSNRDGILGHETNGKKCVPKRVNLMNVNKICSNGWNTYFLTNEGLIYFCGEYEENGKKQQNTPTKMDDSDMMFSDLPQTIGLIFTNIFCVDSKNSFYTLFGKNLDKLNDDNQSFIELYAKHHQITPQTVHICSENPEKYFIIQNGVELYPCDDRNGQKTNDLVEDKFAKQNISRNSILQINKLQVKFVRFRVNGQSRKPNGLENSNSIR